MFCFKFKIHALSNSRVTVLETTFFVHGNCCQLFQRTFPFFFFFWVKLEPNSAASKLMTDHWSDVNNFVSYSSALVSSTQRNIVLPCKLGIPESKLLALFKPLRITFFHENSHFVVFQSFKMSCSKQQLWLAAAALAAILFWFKWHVTRPKTHAIEANLVSRLFPFPRERLWLGLITCHPDSGWSQIK